MPQTWRLSGNAHRNVGRRTLLPPAGTKSPILLGEEEPLPSASLFSMQPGGGSQGHVWPVRLSHLALLMDEHWIRNHLLPKLCHLVSTISTMELRPLFLSLLIYKMRDTYPVLPKSPSWFKIQIFLLSHLSFP